MEECLICSKHKNKQLPLIKGEFWLVYLGNNKSKIPGYLCMEPKRHVENWSEFQTEELYEIGKIIAEVETKLASVIDLERLYTVTISEKVRHLHFHLIPRLVNESRKGISLIKDATEGNQREVDKSYDDLENKVISVFEV